MRTDCEYTVIIKSLIFYKWHYYAILTVTYLKNELSNVLLPFGSVNMNGSVLKWGIIVGFRLHYDTYGQQFQNLKSILHKISAYFRSFCHVKDSVVKESI